METTLRIQCENQTQNKRLGCVNRVKFQIPNSKFQIPKTIKNPKLLNWNLGFYYLIFKKLHLHQPVSHGNLVVDNAS